MKPDKSTTIRPTGHAMACARCGDTLFAPERSEFAGERRVRHVWACESCGYAFRTLVHVVSRAGLRSDAA
jgi:RNase P subunit RPR2